MIRLARIGKPTNKAEVTGGNSMLSEVKEVVTRVLLLKEIHLVLLAVVTNLVSLICFLVEVVDKVFQHKGNGENEHSKDEVLKRNCPSLCWKPIKVVNVFLS